MLVAKARRPRRITNGEICGISWSWPRLARPGKTLKGVAVTLQSPLRTGGKSTVLDLGQRMDGRGAGRPGGSEARPDALPRAGCRSCRGRLGPPPGRSRPVDRG